MRFVFGGLITVATGIIAQRYGPATGGLFLAFPAIFPAAVTLVEKDEREKKRLAHKQGTIRGREAAALDAAGAAIGNIGLIGFAVVAWLLLADYNPIVVLCGATGMWLAISGLGWDDSAARFSVRSSAMVLPYAPGSGVTASTNFLAVAPRSSSSQLSSCSSLDPPRKSQHKIFRQATEKVFVGGSKFG